MHVALEIIRTIFLPLQPMLRAWKAVLDFLRGFDAILSDPEGYRALSDTPEGRADFAGNIAFAEDGINLLVAARTRELLGLPRKMGKWRPGVSARAHPIHILMARYNRMRASIAKVEQHARRRAARLLREMGDNPLRLAPSAQSTSPAFAVEATHRCLLIVQIASLSAQHWGRWIVRFCAQDGGGRATARGPPLPSASNFRNPASEAQLLRTP